MTYWQLKEFSPPRSPSIVHLSQETRGPVRNPGTSQMKQAQVVLSLFLPADQQTAKTIHPTMSPLNDPTSSFVTDLAFDGLSFFIPRSNMQCVAKLLAQF